VWHHNAMGKHAQLTDKKLASELRRAKQRVNEDLREAEQSHRYADEIAAKSRKQAKSSLGKP